MTNLSLFRVYKTWLLLSLLYNWVKVPSTCRTKLTLTKSGKHFKTIKCIFRETRYIAPFSVRSCFLWSAVCVRLYKTQDDKFSKTTQNSKGYCIFWAGSCFYDSLCMSLRLIQKTTNLENLDAYIQGISTYSNYCL